MTSACEHLIVTQISIKANITITSKPKKKMIFHRFNYS